MDKVVYGRYYVRIPNETPFSPETLTYSIDWVEYAACRGMNYEQFFDFKVNSRYIRMQKEVFDVCSACPVRNQCLSWALTHEPVRDNESGIFAAYVPSQRGLMLNRATSGLLDFLMSE